MICVGCWNVCSLSNPTQQNFRLTAEPPQAHDGDDCLSCVTSVDKIRAALLLLKNGTAPSWDEITSKLLKLGSEAVHGAVPAISDFFGVGIEVSPRRLAEGSDCPTAQEGAYPGLRQLHRHTLAQCPRENLLQGHPEEDGREI